MSDKVSIIIPYKEDRGYLSQAIKSVENQSYKNVELILSQGSGSVGVNFNKGLLKAKGKYVKILAEDDILPKDSVFNSLKGFKKGIDFIHGNATEFTDIISKGHMYKPLKTNPTLEQSLTANYFHGGTMMYKRDMIKKIGDFNESLWTGEEYEFHLRALFFGCKVGYVDNNLHFYRRHINQKSIGSANKVYQLLRKEHINDFKEWYR